MAQIDTSIYNNLQPVKIASPFENAAMAAQIQQGQNQNRLAQRQFQEADRADMERNALADLYRNSVGADGSIDYRKVTSGLAAGGYGDKVAGIVKQQNEAAASGVELNNKTLTGQKLQGDITHEQKTRAIAKIGAFIQDPNLSADMLLADLQNQVQIGELKFEQAQGLAQQIQGKTPEQLRPLLTNMLNGMLTPQQQMTQGNSDRSYGMDVAKFKYQQGNDAANRGVTMRGQDISANNAAAGRAVTMRGQDMTDKRAANPVAKQGKPMPAAALRMQQEELDAIATASSINADIGTVEQQIKGGKLNLGPLDNMLAKGRNIAGISNESSRNYATFQSTLEKLRNDSLRLNKGVQTDGDSQRAWNELLTNINDPKVVSQRLSEIKKINKRAANIREMNVENIRNNYGAGPLNTSGYSKQPTALGGDKLPGGWTVKEK